MQWTARERAHVVPGHACSLEDVKLIADIVVDLLKIKNSCVIVILSGKERAGEFGRVHIRKWAGDC